MALLVALDLPGGPGFVVALMRAWEAGAAVLPLDQRLSGRAKEELVRDLAPGAIVDATGRTDLSGGVPVDEGDALVVATSATTGTAKGVVLTHAAVAASAAATSARLAVDPSRHRWLACLPLSHVGGLSVVTRALLSSTPLEVHPGFDAGAVMAAATSDTLVSLVPTALRRIDPGRFRTVVLGGSAPPGDLPANVVTTYGMTETGSGVVYDGVPLAGVEVSIAAGGPGSVPGSGPGAFPGPGSAKGPRSGTSTGLDLGSGEIRLRGPMLLRAYRDGTVPLTTDGWLATGDAGAIGSDGRLVVHGRLSELIITGGENVWPSAVEAVLRRHPAVAEAAVAGRPDPEWGEKVVAWVVPADAAAPPSLPELRALVTEAMAPWASPKEMILVPELPRTSIGKIRRAALP